MRRELLICLPLIILYGLLTFFVRDNAFFWDTIQFASLHPHFYFENNFSQFILPPEMDSGHPPFFGIYLAGMWSFFGKHLWVSHFAMLPFLLANIFLFYQLGIYFLGHKFAFAFPLVCLIDPIYIGQAVLVSPEIVLVFFFLLALIGVLEERPILKMVGLLGMAMISTRGMMCMVIIFLLDLVLFIRKDPLKNVIRSIPFYLPAAIAGFGFLFYHYQQTGWIGYHEGSSWAPAFDRVGPKGLLKNFMVLGWRLLDFGHVFVLLVLFLAGLYGYKSKAKLDHKLGILLLLTIFCFFLLTPTFLLHHNLNGHRYLIPLYLATNFLCLYLVFNTFLREPIRNLYFTIVFAGLLTGNLWVYPDYISQGWDSTLAHLPYYDLRNEMIDFIDENEIPYEQIGTCFPNKLSQKLIDLKTNEAWFAEKDLDKNEYIFYSNIFNDFTDEELNVLANDWQVVQAYSNFRIRVILFKRPT